MPRSAMGPAMKLIRFDKGKTGLVIDRADGRYVIDVVGSLGALAADDLIAREVLSGVLKDNGSWATVIEQWPHVRRGLQKLVPLALAREASGLVMRRLDEVHLGDPSGNPDGIASIDIAEQSEVALHPTGRELMARQAAHPDIAAERSDRGVFGFDACLAEEPPWSRRV
ncbi:hypothetical protein C7I85_03840 [Mesorhizobium soli]|uniref:Fumarylacetoacetate hydrolase n=2 Tax=Pseudaminobacter soli (ex Li et al. 2025) TaxID=1295366 RepID=A0A2P7SK55_9HYPH|nr:hypothetical protein C7I85_03840 [Mesorhizobium soli]